MNTMMGFICFSNPTGSLNLHSNAELYSQGNKNARINEVIK